MLNMQYEGLGSYENIARPVILKPVFVAPSPHRWHRPSSKLERGRPLEGAAV